MKKKTQNIIGSTVCLIAALIFSFAIAGCSTKSAVRVGSVEHTTSTEWSESHMQLDGTMSYTLNVKSGTLEVEITTNSGSIALEIVDGEGTTVYRGNDLATCSFSVGAKGKTKIKVTGKEHSGSFSFKVSEKSGN